MSYLDPRGGPSSSGDRSSDADAPAPYAAYWVPDGDEEPPGTAAGTHRAEPAVPPYEQVGPPDEQVGPDWNAPTAATSTSEAEFALTAGEVVPGRRRAEARTARRAAATCPPRSRWGWASVWS